MVSRTECRKYIEYFIDVCGFILLTCNGVYILSAIIMLGVTKDAFKAEYYKKMAALILTSMFLYIFQIAAHTYNYAKTGSFRLSNHKPIILHYILALANIIIIICSASIVLYADINDVDDAFVIFYKYMYVWNILHFIFQIICLMYGTIKIYTDVPATPAYRV